MLERRYNGVLQADVFMSLKWFKTFIRQDVCVYHVAHSAVLSR